LYVKHNYFYYIYNLYKYNKIITKVVVLDVQSVLKLTGILVAHRDVFRQINSFVLKLNVNNILAEVSAQIDLCIGNKQKVN